jgi:hypothetical protein
MTMERPQLRRIQRNVYQHRWDDIDDWAQSFHDLADLDEHELIELTRLTRGEHPNED